MFGALLIISALIVFAVGVLLIRGNVAKDEEALISTIDRLLPQTQCAQCGYPGCKPYAQAVTEGENIDLCPPGGPQLVAELSDLMGIAIPDRRLDDPVKMIALIDEKECIGCALCLAPCPVDAIVGAQGFMHTVLNRDCTGCELCIAPCPVDCISLVPADKNELQIIEDVFQVLGSGCINCGQCAPACPKELIPDQLLKLGSAKLWSQASSLQLQDCIECSLCDSVCPSEINLAQFFAHGKTIERQRQNVETEKIRILDRYEHRQHRLKAKEEQTNQQRQQRMQARLKRIEQGVIQ
jgi:electron transport complex protein RnfB